MCGGGGSVIIIKYVFVFVDPDIGYQMSSTDARRDCCYEHCADRLCVRNASMCVTDDGGAVYGDQRPVCVDQNRMSRDDDSECPDYDADGGAGRRTAASDGTTGWLLAAVASWWLIRTAPMAAVT